MRTESSARSASLFFPVFDVIDIFSSSDIRNSNIIHWHGDSSIQNLTSSVYCVNEILDRNFLFFSAQLEKCYESFLQGKQPHSITCARYDCWCVKEFISPLTDFLQIRKICVWKCNFYSLISEIYCVYWTYYVSTYLFHTSCQSNLTDNTHLSFQMDSRVMQGWNLNWHDRIFSEWSCYCSHEDPTLKCDVEKTHKNMIRWKQSIKVENLITIWTLSCSWALISISSLPVPYFLIRFQPCHNTPHGIHTTPHRKCVGNLINSFTQANLSCGIMLDMFVYAKNNDECFLVVWFSSPHFLPFSV